MDMSEKILERLKLGTYDTGIIETNLYSLIVIKDSYYESKQLYDSIRRFEREYHDLFTSLRFGRPHDIKRDTWFRVECKEKPHAPKLLGVFEVVYKEYFAFIPTSEKVQDIYSEITRFIKSIPYMYEEIYDQNNRYVNGTFSIKVIGNLRGLLTRNDNLVIHYSNKDLGPKIREIVNLVGRNQKFVLSSELRGESGFDFYERTHPELSSTHTQLVSKVIAKKIIKNADALVKFSASDMAAWLKREITEVSKWDDDKIYGSI